MSRKSLFVMDETENCVDCQFCYEHDEGIEAWCIIAIDPYNEDSYREMEEDYCQCKPYWCPLKPMPEKIVLDKIRQEAINEDCYDDTNGINEAYLQGKEIGWNGCIDEIMDGCKDEND